MQDYFVDVLCLAPLVILLIGLTFAVLLDRYTRADQRRTLLLIMLVELLLVAQNYISWLLDSNSTAILSRRTEKEAMKNRLLHLSIPGIFALPASPSSTNSSSAPPKKQ